MSSPANSDLLRLVVTWQAGDATGSSTMPGDYFVNGNFDRFAGTPEVRPRGEPKQAVGLLQSLVRW